LLNQTREYQSVKKKRRKKKKERARIAAAVSIKRVYCVSVVQTGTKSYTVHPYNQLAEGQNVN